MTLIDLDSEFYAARYLRARLLEATLRQRLLEDFGPGWMLDARAGKFICGLWSEGQRWSAEELCVRLGIAGLDEKALISLLEL